MEYSLQPKRRQKREEGTKKQMGQVENKNQDGTFTRNHINNSLTLNNNKNNNKKPTRESTCCITPFI